jgi:hypothetical protein
VYKVVVYAKRGDQPVYSYTVHDRVKGSKVDRIVLDTVTDVITHETRSGLTGAAQLLYHGGVIGVLSNRFVVKAWRL